MRWDNATAVAVGVLIASTTTRVLAAPSEPSVLAGHGHNARLRVTREVLTWSLSR
jgi:hypothetical protein